MTRKLMIVMDLITWVFVSEHEKFPLNAEVHIAEQTTAKHIFRYQSYHIVTHISFTGFNARVTYEYLWTIKFAK